MEKLEMEWLKFQINVLPALPLVVTFQSKDYGRERGALAK